MLGVKRTPDVVYTLKQGSKTVGFYSNGTPYVIGFRNIIHARKVHYDMKPEPRFQMMMSDDVTIKDDVSIHFASTIFIPKHSMLRHHDSGSTRPLLDDPMKDVGLHLHIQKAIEFYRLPQQGVGIIMPYELLDEDTNEFTFRAHILYRLK
jgi:hypothetical protein